MDKSVKKVVSYILIALVLLFTVIAVLGVWEFIDLSNVIQKIMSSLLIIFAASAVVLFIFAVLIKENGASKQT
jgi:polyferredoxin